MFLSFQGAEPCEHCGLTHPNCPCPRVKGITKHADGSTTYHYDSDPVMASITTNEIGAGKALARELSTGRYRENTLKNG